MSNFIDLNLACKIMNDASEPEYCTWAQYKQHYRYETGCNKVHYFFSGTVSSSEFIFCPYCGKPIKDVPFA